MSCLYMVQQRALGEPNINTVGAVFKSADSIVLKPFLMGILLQCGFYCSADSIAKKLKNWP